MAIELRHTAEPGWRARGDVGVGVSRSTFIARRPGMDLRVVSDLVGDALSGLGCPDHRVVVTGQGVTVDGVAPADLIPPLCRAAEQHERSREHYERSLEAMELETPESDLWLARWNRAELQHEQSLLLISYLRESVAA